MTEQLVRITIDGKAIAVGAANTIIQALASAGGLAEWADEKDIQIIRREGDKEIRIPFNYKEFIKGENVGQNILLQPGDTIVIP